MRSLRFTTPIVVAIASVVALAACGEISSPTPAAPKRAISPELAASLSRGGSASVPVLERDKAIGSNVSQSETIDSRGGWVFLWEAGFSLYVPAGAVKKSTRFTVTAVPGKLVAYEFEPHGTAFPVALTAYQGLWGTHTKGGKLDPSSLFVGYFQDRSDTDDQRGQADIREAFTLSFDGKAQVVAFPIAHFSGYLVATGRDN